MDINLNQDHLFLLKLPNILFTLDQEDRVALRNLKVPRNQKDRVARRDAPERKEAEVSSFKE